MNRIRKFNDIYQVLITPNIKFSPDSSMLIGNWDDENLRNYYILNFESLNDAQTEAFKHPDINWHKLVVNHEHIYRRLNNTIQKILEKYEIVAELQSKLMTAGEFKNAMFNRVMANGARFNLRFDLTDIISFTIINPWTEVLHKLSQKIENHREHLFSDTLRIKEKKIIDSKIIILYGITEFGTMYEIKLVPTLLYQWGEWFKNKSADNKSGNDIYKRIIKQQNIIDKGPIIL